MALIVNPIQRILCPIDRSDISRRALDHAIDLARWYSARLRVLEVIDPPPARAGSSRWTNGDSKSALEDLQRVVKARRTEDLTLDVAVEHGPVVRTILDAADSADLVVIGTHGRGGFRRFVLGSVTEKVIRQARSLVLTIPPAVREEGVKSTPFTRILCATDFSVPAAEAVSRSRVIAADMQADLLLMHVVDWPFEPDVPDPLKQLKQNIEDEARGQLTKLAATVQSKNEVIVRAGKAGRQLVDVAREREVDLVVLGIAGRGALDLAVLGSTAHYVVRESPAPVLTVGSR